MNLVIIDVLHCFYMLSRLYMFQVTPIPAFNDNYIWMLSRNGGTQVYVVDPGDAAPVLDVLEKKSLTLVGILITHHHSDHIGGIDTLLSRYDVPVYGPHNPKIESISQRVSDGDKLEVLGSIFNVIEVPGHTLDHITYYCKDNEPPLLFCGDTLFAGGCGRLFEGSAAQMHTSLSKLADLPGATQVFCAHEYTLANLSFASAVEPNSKDLKNHVATCTALREQNQPTVPSTIGKELAINPFMRSHTDSVKAAAEAYAGEKLTSPVEVFRVTRAWKDNF